MKCLITGGAGYLGSILVSVLLATCHRITVLDDFRWGQNSLAHLCADPNLTIVRGDVRNEGLMMALLVDADAIIPLAALVGAPLCDRDPIGAITTNRDAIRTLCTIASKDQAIIIPISNSGYGVGERGKECTEDSPLRPVSLYGRTKVEAEEAALSRENSVSLRLATLFGMSPRMRIDLLVNDFVHRAVTDRAVVLFEAHFRRNFLHVLDAALAFHHALDNVSRMRGRAYNVGLSDANLTKRQLCERIKAHVPEFAIVEAEVGRDPDKRDCVVSNARMEATGWKPLHSLDDGIRELIKGYQMIGNKQYGNVP